MKATSLTALSLFFLSVSARNFFQQLASTGQQRLGNTNTNNKHVPGESPLEFCGDPSNDIFIIESVNLIPNLPVAGQPLEIEVVGKVKEDIVPGAYAEITVKWNLVTLYRDPHADLCKNAKQVYPKGCPVPQGTRIIVKKTVDVPKTIPPGTYHITANAVNKNSDPITCLTATVHYG